MNKLVSFGKSMIKEFRRLVSKSYKFRIHTEKLNHINRPSAQCMIIFNNRKLSFIPFITRKSGREQDRVVDTQDGIPIRSSCHVLRRSLFHIG
ncbi:hypothetical protein GE061_008558 [Apolygus lucorum]|uniref:Uncharacterized protein n=1 Tax=Apolygus lucorum TaxID=248454 RepID=A0A8S9WKZ4_APOLU|nr:hypothetical protein GE061_008558 [Apolygus lucorum]